jgi:4-amino-4-deoxy-L-arabinose transferase-like glycosyltransferase
MHDDGATAATDRNEAMRTPVADPHRLVWLARLSGRTLPYVLLAVVILFGTVLRLDALTGAFGRVSEPAWLQALQRGAQTLIVMLHLPLESWQPEPEHPHQDGPPTRYRSDPYTYLQRAREMGSFYGAHYREPVFPFVVKGWLWLLNDQDVAVSFASASFSVLCVLVTYFMGTIAFSRWVGCAAAFGMAIEREVISWGVGGWRDDAFAFAVVLSVCSMLYHRRAPSAGSAVALGVSAALACLTRVFSLSFLGPGFLFLLVWPAGSWRRRLRGLMIATLTAMVLVAPYLVNCWREFGDPLYALNYQPLYYLAAEHAPSSTTPGAAGYIGGKLLDAPAQTLDTWALGMTSYPFLNKWDGFEPWLPGLGRWLGGAALVGLILFAASGNGRLLLLVLASAQVPFAFTWRLSADWRYTEFTYPFFLVAAGLVITNVAAFARPSRWRRLAARTPSRVTVGAWALSLGSIAVAAWMILRVFPVLALREALRANHVAVIAAGPRDGSFFREGWSGTVKTGNVTARVAGGELSVVDIPLPRSADYSVTVRLDPFPPPSDGADDLPSVRILFNGVLLRTVPLTWNPEKVGAYDLVLRRALVKPGLNRLMFAGDHGSAEDATVGGRRPNRGFKLWYVLVRPAPASRHE